jgi:cardiolipin synthase
LSGSEIFENPLIDEKRSLITLLLNNSSAVVTIGNNVEVLQRKNHFDAIIKALESATSFIHLEYYIFAEDEIGGIIKDILKRKAAEGVEVRLIVDDVGSWELKKPFLRRCGRLVFRLIPFFRFGSQTLPAR